MVENLFVKQNSLQDLLSSLNALISTNKRAWILTGHVTFKLRYNQIYQMKTTYVSFQSAYNLLKNHGSNGNRKYDLIENDL